MSGGLTITKQVHFRRGGCGRKVIEEDRGAKVPELGTVPRLSRLMALAIHMDDLVRWGEVADYAELARLAHVSRARVTQIMNLLHLAPDIQEEILNLPRPKGSRGAISERMIRPIAAVPDWGKQMTMWILLTSRDSDALILYNEHRSCKCPCLKQIHESPGPPPRQVQTRARVQEDDPIPRHRGNGSPRTMKQGGSNGRRR